MRIGLVSDTHVPQVGKDLFPEILEGLRGVDLILHGGDITVSRVLDELEKIAPVYAARGNNDQHLEDHRVKDVHFLELEGFQIALLHRFEPLYMPITDLMDSWLQGRRVDIVICGDTHYEMAEWRDGVLLINGGSATLPRLKKAQLGHIGFLTLERGKTPTMEFVDLGQRHFKPAGSIHLGPVNPM